MAKKSKKMSLFKTRLQRNRVQLHNVSRKRSKELDDGIRPGEMKAVADYIKGEDA